MKTAPDLLFRDMGFAQDPRPPEPELQTRLLVRDMGYAQDPSPPEPELQTRLLLLNIAGYSQNPRPPGPELQARETSPTMWSPPPPRKMRK